LNQLGGYIGKILRVDLTRFQITEELIEEAVFRKYIGGVSLGANYLYDGVPPRVSCFDPDNQLIFASGPLSGTQVRGSSNVTVVSKGALTNGAATSQANGFLAAYMKFSGFDTVVIQGAAQRPVYLYLHDGIGELRDASHLVDKDTIEIGTIIRKESGISGRQVSVLCTGPAAEKLVKFAGIIIDGAHSCSHNGLGAIMGSKKLKAIVAARSKASVEVKDRERLSALSDDIFEAVLGDRMSIRDRERLPALSSDMRHYWSTADILCSYMTRGVLPVRNYTTSVFPECTMLLAPMQTHFEIIKRHPCWACRMIHSNQVRVTRGPYTGYEGKEPEYSHFAMLGSNIGVTDPGTVFMLTDVIDRLGLELTETGWIISWMMECCDKGLLNAKDTNGLEMTWGNAGAVSTMLLKIARREGFGDMLAEGLKHIVEHIGGEAADCAVYTKRGTTPGAHDERAEWFSLLDIVFSNTGWREHRAHSQPADWGLLPLKDPFSPEDVSTMLARIKGAQQFSNSVGACIFCTKGYPSLLTQILNAATGWDFTLEEALEVGRRAVNLLRVFNIRHGLTPDQETPTPRYGSTPVDGPAKGKSAIPHWEYIQRNYYEQMGWDGETGKPLPETLQKLGLGHIVPDIWKERMYL